MRMTRRNKVNKGRSARRFKKQVGKTKAANLRGAPMRGGFRF